MARGPNPDPRRWQLHNRNLQDLDHVWEVRGSDPTSPRIIAPWLSDTVQLTYALQGVFRVEAVDVPAAGAEFSNTVPTGRIWRILSLHFLLTSAVAAANRFVQIRITSPSGARIWQAGGNFTQVASLGVRYSMANAGILGNSVAGGEGSVMIPLPSDFWLLQGFTIASVTQNIQAADQFSSIRILLEARSDLDQR